MKQIIETKLGVIIILIFAVTAGAFVWKWERHEDEEIQVLNINVKENTIEKDKPEQQIITTNQHDCLGENNSNTTEWNIFKNNQFKFEIQYPPTFIYSEKLTGTMAHPPGVGVQYVIELGIPIKTSGGGDSNCATSNNFSMYISDIGSGMNEYIKSAKQTARDVENSFDSMSTEKVANFIASVVKTCDMGGSCNKEIYFTDGKYIYAIRLSNYFTLKDATSKGMIDRMLASLKFNH